MAYTAFSQSFSINNDGSTADTSAILDVKSNAKGLLLPRMTKTEKNLIFSPAEGLLIYQTGPDSLGFHYYRNGWHWLTNNSKADTAYWKTAGNTGTTSPSVTALAPIDGNYIGTTDARDFVIGVNNLERMRFKAGNTFIGLGSTDPQYALDVTLNYDATSACLRNGFRLRLPSSINAGCDAGYFMGYPNALSASPAGNDILFWNFDGTPAGNNNVFRWGFGTDTATGLGMKLAGPRLGIAQTSPLYALDIRTNPDAVAPCLMNGIRMTHPVQNQGCNNGIFFGFNPMDSPDGATIWNYGSGGSTTNYLRLGVNDDINGETMRILSHRVGINVTDPQAVLHIKDVSAIRNGLRITHPAGGATGSFYFGANTSLDELEVSSEYDDPIRFYTNVSVNPQARMTIHENGNVNVGPSVSAPNSTLQVEGTIAVGVSTGVAGGGAGTPVSLATLGAYISLNPSAGSDEYNCLTRPPAPAASIISAITALQQTQPSFR